jgi:membrane-bound lytic murein transglycosylase B
VDTNGDGEIDVQETRDAARKVAGLTPLSEESRQFDSSWTLNVAPDVKDQHTDEVTFNVEREIAHNVDRRHVRLQTHERHLRQHSHQQRDRPAMGLRANPLRHARGPARDAL